jgi:gallate dioxygenase
MTGIAVAVYENESADDPTLRGACRTPARAHRSSVEGIEQLDGTYPFTLETSVRAYRINRYLHQLIEPAFRERFRPIRCHLRRRGTDAEERDMITRRDWRGMIHYGVIFFLLEKLGAVCGVSNLHIYAAMRGQSLEDFQKTRNAPGALYSVAGSGSASWSAKS